MFLWGKQAFINEIGEYFINIKAIDKSGNESTKDIRVIVIEKEKEIIEVPNGNTGSTGTTNGGNNSNNNSTDSNMGTVTGDTGNTNPSIACGGNKTLKVGDSETELHQIASNVTFNGSGYLVVDFYGVNLTVAGTYPIHYVLEGVTIGTCYVTVIE